MLKSMTGFGKSMCEFPKKNVIVEIKSLNSKQLDLNVKVPYLYKEKEMEIRSLLSSCLQRGKVDVAVFCEMKDESVSRQINKAVVTGYYKQLQAISNELEYDAPDLLPIIMRLPDVMNAEVEKLDENEWQTVLQTVQQAIEAIDSFRCNEGDVLEKDLVKRVVIIQDNLSAIEAFEKLRMDRLREKLFAWLDEFVGKANIDANRFEQELIYYMEKLDITEEKVRLRQHCNYFFETIEADEPPGRKLGFIAQEMGREINTIGSKANDADMQKHVVLMKDELEKIKEQLLNVL